MQSKDHDLAESLNLARTKHQKKFKNIINTPRASRIKCPFFSILSRTQQDYYSFKHLFAQISKIFFNFFYSSSYSTTQIKMKVAIFTSVLCLFSGLVSAVAIPAPETPAIEARAIATISPSLSVPIYQDDPDYAGGSQNYALVYRVSCIGLSLFDGIATKNSFSTMGLMISILFFPITFPDIPAKNVASPSPLLKGWVVARKFNYSRLVGGMSLRMIPLTPVPSATTGLIASTPAQAYLMRLLLSIAPLLPLLWVLRSSHRVTGRLTHFLALFDSFTDSFIAITFGGI